ncbi:hypothetical protein KQI84_16825 [bacterium]|nr:hypothetical protein [bacterium]
MSENTKRITSNVPRALFDRVTQRAEVLWGENDSESGIVATVLRDWLSLSERGSFDARLDQMERRVEHLLTVRPVEGFRDDRPTLDDPQVRRRLRLQEVAPVVTMAGVKLPELPKKPSPKEISKRRSKLISEHRSKGVGFDFIEFQYIHGYDPKGHVEFSAYERAGFPLLRDAAYYNMQEPTMKQILDRCWTNTKFTCAPLLTYSYGGKLIVLDGLARFTALMEVWRQGLGTPTRLPIELFFGDLEEARREMIMRNLHGGPRSLTRSEFERAVDWSKGLA